MQHPKILHLIFILNDLQMFCLGRTRNQP